MKYPRYDKEINELLQREGIIEVKDFIRIFGDMPMTSVYARIRTLVEGKRVSVVGKGRYMAVSKPPYRVEISPWMKRCNEVMIRELEGVNSCLIERKGNLEVEVDKKDLVRTVEVLRKHFDRVMYRKDVKWLVEAPKGYVLVGKMVTDSPILREDGLEVPGPEKEIVDALCRKEENPHLFQRVMEVYAINRDRLRRYASRRGVADELEASLAQVNQERVDMITNIQRYLSKTNIIRAWVFGSFARGEEKDTSDLDLLVDYEKSSGLSLLGIVRYQLDMEELIGRQVDLVENGYLKPFARASAERDKYLIYERVG